MRVKLSAVFLNSSSMNAYFIKKIKFDKFKRLTWENSEVRRFILNGVQSKNVKGSKISELSIKCRSENS